MHAKASIERFADPMEHRWGQRVALDVPASLAVAGVTSGSGVLRNASISGALIETALELQAFTNLVVSLGCTSESVPTTFALEACVTRRTPGGFAVEWRDMACPSIIGLLERVTGLRANSLVEDEAYIHGR
jgi:hypothetical protein